MNFNNRMLKYTFAKFKKIAICSYIVFTFSGLYAQDKINYGLAHPQDSADLPKSRVPVIFPQKKEKIKANTVLKPLLNNEFEISGGWEMISASDLNVSGLYVANPDLNTKKWYNATVPGTVLTTLVDQGVYPDPYYGLNNLAIPENLSRQNWWYRTTFKTPDLSTKKNVWLIFNGINYQADIWLNGKLLGKINGAFMRGNYDITKYLNTKGENVIAVRIIPPQNPGIPHEESPRAGRGPNGGLLTLDGPTFFATEGWDWMPGIRDRNIGIWQDVRIKLVNDVTISNPHVVTDLPLPDTSKAHLFINTEINNHSSTSKKVLVSGNIGNINFSKEIELKAGEQRVISFTPEQFEQLKMTNPRLWWPNGYGKQELYHLNLSVAVDGLKSDERTIRFGVRELSYDMTVDMPDEQAKRIDFNPIKALKSGRPLFDNSNRRELAKQVSIPSLLPDVDPKILDPSSEIGTAPYLVIKVNGQKIYCKGGNWGMDDAMKRVSRAQLEPYFKLHKDANFNMIRNWTGESTEEVLFDLSDEYGMLVWNDFWISTQGYNMDVSDENLFMDNATDVVKRYRNHPSIVLWCPRNEGYAPKDLDLKLATLIAKEDGTRLYQGNSRSLNLRTSGPWDYQKTPMIYYNKLSDGFSTELGTPSIPTAASMRKMMAKEDVWPISDTWFYHDLHFGQKPYLRTIDSLYGPASNLEEFCKKAQMVNYDSHRAMFEAWNSKLWNNTSGLLLWMTHPAWPSTIWQVYSWDYETFGSYFASQKACEPVHVQLNLNDNQVVVVNTSLNTYQNTLVSLEVFDIKGTSIYKQKTNINILSNQLNPAFKATLPNDMPDVYLVRLILKDKEGNIISNNDYWKNNKKAGNFLAFNALENIKLDIKLNGTKKAAAINTYFTVTNKSSVPAIGVKLNLKDLISEEIILPAYFSDGYFTLLPGESRKIKVEYPNLNKDVEIAVDGYNIQNNKNVKISFTK